MPRRGGLKARNPHPVPASSFLQTARRLFLMKSIRSSRLLRSISIIVTGKPPQYPERVLTAEKPTLTAAPPPRGSATRNPAALEARLAELEHAINVAKAYDAVENLIGAYAYYLDESPSDMASLFERKLREKEAPRSMAPEGTVFVNQILQPVIDIAADGKSAKVRARLLDLGGISGGHGYWTAGAFEGQFVSQRGSWRIEWAGST